MVGVEREAMRRPMFAPLISDGLTFVRKAVHATAVAAFPFPSCQLVRPPIRPGIAANSAYSLELLLIL